MTWMRAILAITNKEQRNFSHAQSPIKLQAKKFAADSIKRHITSGRLLDIGGEEFYHHHFSQFEITTWNLPTHDMHNIDLESIKFDVILAMHVLEHSPFPLYVLFEIRDVIKQDGLVYIAVPECNRRFNKPRFNHWTVLRPEMWEKLIKTAGFSILEKSKARFGDRKTHVEYRYLCRPE
jgi:SAM-dependent methyltransferase